MMSQETWSTAITEIQPNEVRLRGYRIDELMGEISFSEAIYLALMGDLPSPAVARMLEAILVSSIDHGTTPPSAMAARTAASTGASLNAAVACGLLSINRFHGGAIQDCMDMLQAGIQHGGTEALSLADLCTSIQEDYQQQKKRLPGLGHRIHNADPRTARLFQLAAELELSGQAVVLLQALQASLSANGKQLPINVDGAIAALLVDLGIPSPLANAFFFISRLPGLVAHVYEEQSRERPMRRIDPATSSYDGPDPRAMKKLSG
jgi:citrate synthase